MNFQERKRYVMESTKNSKYWHEIEVRYIIGDKVNFIVKDSFDQRNIGSDHTFSLDGAFFTEYEVLTVCGGEYIPSDLKRLYMDLALATKDFNWCKELTGGK